MDTPADPTIPDIAELRREIDRLDARIITLVRQRTAVSRRIGRIRAARGGPRIVAVREAAVLDRFRELGREGHDLGTALLRLGRGRDEDPAADGGLRAS